MYNLVHMFVAILKEAELITEDGAKKLSKELSTQILSSDVNIAFKQVEEVAKRVELLKAEPWLKEISRLHNVVGDLETRLKAVEGKSVKPPVAKK